MGWGVGGVVVDGSHAAIWSARVLDVAMNVITDPLGTSAEAAALSVTMLPVTLCAVLPAAILGPKIVIPALIPVVLAAPPKVSVVVPDGQSAVVVAVTGDFGTPANVISDPLGTSPETGALSTTVLAATLRTVVTAVMLGPKTAIPALIPVVPPAPPKASVVPDGQSAVVTAVTGGSA